MGVAVLEDRGIANIASRNSGWCSKSKSNTKFFMVEQMCESQKKEDEEDEYTRGTGC